MTGALKRCSHCRKVKPAEQFSRNASRYDGLHHACKACAAAKNAAYHTANKEAIHARQAAYRTANKKAITAKRAAYYAAHKDAEVARNASWRVANKEALAAYYAARTAKALSTGVCASGGCTTRWASEPGNTGPYCYAHIPFPAKGREPALFEAQRTAKTLGWDPRRCVYCGGPAQHGDHLAPKSRFPELQDSLFNLAPACRACNYDKRAKTLAEWAPTPPPDAAIFLVLAKVGYDQPPGSIPRAWREQIVSAGGAGLPDAVYSAKKEEED